MCSGFIATVAKKITVLVGQKDPKISNSALAMGRGTEVSETLVANSADTRSALHRSQWNLGDVLEDLIARSGQSAVPFLYSDAAADFFTELRTRPDTMQKVVKELCHPAPLAMIPARLPASSNRLNLDLAGVTQPRGRLLLNDYRGVAPAPDFRNLQRQGGQVTLANQPLSIRGLDLEVGNIKAARHFALANQDAQVKGLVDAMAQIQNLLASIKASGIIHY